MSSAVSGLTYLLFLRGSRPGGGRGAGGGGGGGGVRGHQQPAVRVTEADVDGRPARQQLRHTAAQPRRAATEAQTGRRRGALRGGRPRRLLFQQHQHTLTADGGSISTH